ncbi:hypothetical protein [Mesorhizobium shangrilense]|uniref:Uncharacterized protein n=1 Tax=Mesorhizobium shangrilense TaxID=460060 RepID=A0ABV2DLR7_9HYPH
MLVLATATTMVSAARKAQDLPAIKEAVFFGDSLTDAGTFGFRFTTAPGLTWA